VEYYDIANYRHICLKGIVIKFRVISLIIFKIAYWISSIDNQEVWKVVSNNTLYITTNNNMFQGIKENVTNKSCWMVCNSCRLYDVWVKTRAVARTLPLGGGGRLDLPKFFQRFYLIFEAPPWLVPSKMFWKFEVSRPLEMEFEVSIPLEIAFLESFLPNISIF
jgi:hypothetical protein